VRENQIAGQDECDRLNRMGEIINYAQVLWEKTQVRRLHMNRTRQKIYVTQVVK